MTLIPAPRRPPTTTGGDLSRILLRAARLRGYVALPRDRSPHLAVLLTPRGGVCSDRRGRLYLAPTSGPFTLGWHWDDTNEPLTADPSEPLQLLNEIDSVLMPGRKSS